VTSPVCVVVQDGRRPQRAVDAAPISAPYAADEDDLRPHGIIVRPPWETATSLRKIYTTNASSGVSGGGGDGGASRSKRQSYTLDDKRRIVAESYAPGASVSRVARRHEINANLLFTWRRQMRTPSASPPSIELIPVDIVDEKPAASLIPAERERRGAIEITLVSGVRVRLDGSVSEATLKRALSALKATT
jgi:transposase